MNQTVPSDTFKVTCHAKDDYYERVMAAVSRHRRLWHQKDKERPHLNFLLIALDGMSAEEVHQHLPRTLKAVGGVELTGFHSVDADTMMVPLLSSYTPDNIAEYSDRSYIQEDSIPWLWNTLSQIDYATQWIEEQPETELWFFDEPFHHYYRAYVQAHMAERMRKCNGSYCCSGELQIETFTELVKEFFRVYRERSKFSLLRLAELRDKNMDVSAMDVPLEKLLKWLSRSKDADKTLVMLFSDHHGVPLSGRSLMTLALPKIFKRQHPQQFEQLMENKDTLSTAADVWKTLLHVMRLHDKDGVSQRRWNELSDVVSVSLLETVKERTCTEANITPHWCRRRTGLCYLGNKETTLVTRAAEKTVEFINSENDFHLEKCSRQALRSVLSSKSWRHREEEGGLIDLVFDTAPHGANFSATVLYKDEWTYSVSKQSISRLDKRDINKLCLSKFEVTGRKFCSCKN